MPTLGQFRGMLLEEALLHLLRRSGYSTVETIRGDPSLRWHSAGIAVRGRGTDHQIDAITDYRLTAPFSHPQRLLVEAKWLSDPAGLEIVRNAVGVHKDICEHWIGRGNRAFGAKKRYHYQYALFCNAGYTSEAQKYAFAQDIYLISLARSQFMLNIIRAIESIGQDDVDRLFLPGMRTKMKKVRQLFRQALRQRSDQSLHRYLRFRGADGFFRDLLAACRTLDGALLVMLGGGIPILLVPEPGLQLDRLAPVVKVKIRFNQESWFLESSEDSRIRLSFDLPEELFRLYARGHALTKGEAITLKEEMFVAFDAFWWQDSGELPTVRTMRFALDREWLQQIKGQLE